MGVENVRVIG
jgi:hypothetical protein